MRDAQRVGRLDFGSRRAVATGPAIRQACTIAVRAMPGGFAPASRFPHLVRCEDHRGVSSPMRLVSIASKPRSKAGEPGRRV